MIQFFNTLSSSALAISLAGSVAGIGNATGVLQGTGSLIGNGAGSSVTTGILVGTGSLIGVGNGVGNSIGILSGTGELIGNTNGVGTSTGILSGTLATPTSLSATESTGTVILTWADSNSDGRSTDPYMTILGSSTSVGTGASSEATEYADGLFQSWWLANFKGAGYNNRALGGQQTSNLRPSPNGTAGRRVNDAVDDGATISVINLPSNDTTAAVAAATQLANLVEMYDYLNTNSVFPLITSTQPRNLGANGSAQRQELANQDQTSASLGSGALSDYNQDSSDNSYRNNFPTENFVRLYELLVDGNADPSNGAFTGTLGTYDTGDGIHLNDAGHAIVFAEVRDQVLAWIQAGTKADSVIIERRINGGSWSVLTTLTSPLTKYTDNSPSGSVEYRVKSTATGYTDSPFTAASTPISISNLAGTSSGTSTTTGILAGTGALSGTSAGTSTATGILIVTGALSGTSAGTSTATGILVGTGALSGTSAGVGTATGVLVVSGAIAGTSAGTSTTTGILVGTGALSGTSAGTSTATGVLVASGGRLLINLAYSNTMAAPDSNSRYWNDILSNSTNDNANTANYTVSNMVDVDNSATTIDFVVVDGASEGYGDGSGANLNGGVSASTDVGDYVYPAGRDSWFTEINDTDGGGQWRFDGLDSGTTYTFKFWGSRAATGTRSVSIATDSGYTDVQSYLADNNTDPDQNAEFTISGVTSQVFYLKSTSGGSAFGYVGVIDIIW
jgi:lysophospholipase L1-like esterase